MSRSQCSSPGATGISGLHSRRTRGDRHSSRVEDWTCLGQHKRHHEFPVVTRESRRNSRKTTWLPRPWDSPGKNTRVDCHFLLQCMKVKSESEVAQWYPALSDPVDCSLPGSSVHGIFQARVLEWGAIAYICISIQYLFFSF